MARRRDRPPHAAHVPGQLRSARARPSAPTTSPSRTSVQGAHAGSSEPRELWFVLIANPDGYDYTFDPENRLWRKNLRDNNGDGELFGGGRRRPEPQLPDRWRYDDEGSNTETSSETYRGTGRPPSLRPRRWGGPDRERVRFRVQQERPHLRAAAAVAPRMAGRRALRGRAAHDGARRRRRGTRRSRCSIRTSAPSCTPRTAIPTTTSTPGPRRSPYTPEGSPGVGTGKRVHLPGRRGRRSGGVRAPRAVRAGPGSLGG